MVLGKLSVLGHPTNLDCSSALAVGAGGVVWTFFLSSIISLLSSSLWEMTRYRLKYCLKGSLNSNNQPTKHHQNLTIAESKFSQYNVHGISE